MVAENLNEAQYRILTAILERGGTDCTGTCHHRKPGEFHCHTLGRMLNISSQGVKHKILELMRLGLLERHRVERKESTDLVRFMITDEGKRALAAYEHSCMETGNCQ